MRRAGAAASKAQLRTQRPSSASGEHTAARSDCFGSVLAYSMWPWLELGACTGRPWPDYDLICNQRPLPGGPTGTAALETAATLHTESMS